MTGPLFCRGIPWLPAAPESFASLVATLDVLLIIGECSFARGFQIVVFAQSICFSNLLVEFAEVHLCNSELLDVYSGAYGKPV